MKSEMWYGVVSALLALILLIPGGMVFAQDSNVLRANPSEISVTLEAGENITKDIEIYNNGSENLSGELGIWGITYDPVAPTVHILSGPNLSIDAGKTVTIAVEIYAADAPAEYPVWNFTIWFSNDNYFQVLAHIQVNTVFPDPSFALQVNREEVKALMFQNQWKETIVRIKNTGNEQLNGTLNISGDVEKGSPHVDILLNGNITKNISLLPKEEKTITLKLYAGDDDHVERTWRFVLTFRANNSDYERNLMAIYIYTENINDKLEISPERYHLYLRVGEVGHVYVRVKNNANITINGSIGGLIPECGCLQTLDINPGNLTLKPGEEKTIDVKITINNRTKAICGEGACSEYAMDLLLQNSTVPWDTLLREPYPVPLSHIYIYAKKEDSTVFTILISAMVVASLLIFGAMYYKRRKS